MKTVLQSIIRQWLKKPTLEARLYACAYPLVATKWHGMDMLVGMRDMTPEQIYGIGDIRIIETFYDRLLHKKEPSTDDLNRYAELHHEILKVAMAVPTYDEMMKIAGAHVDSKSVEAELAEIKELFRKMPTGPEKKRLKDRYDGLELASKFLLPADFTAPLVTWAMGISRTDISKLTHDVLVKLYILAKKCHDKPSDHIQGNFERYQGDTFIKDNINSQAEIAWEREVEKLRRGPVS